MCHQLAALTLERKNLSRLPYGHAVCGLLRGASL
ncbi:Uncharacterised protein [Vibrio cholerae]|nr:Uncharacterised protein [Vibrio cholerae]CSB35174.1 Uncharacterised protein [Vibrio cholerae]CSC55373.1 Uncharacterised protein [Vibrio cholerae]CSI83614.1 Uncharacterised protein [Vibrio cholerae]